MIGHKECDYCGDVGHQKDMIRKVMYHEWVYYHKQCYMDFFNLVSCPCGKGFISKVVSQYIEDHKNTKPKKGFPCTPMR